MYPQREVEKYHGVENVQCCSLQFLILFQVLFHHPQLEARVFMFSKCCFRVVLGFEVFLMTTADTVELKDGLSVPPLSLRTLHAEVGILWDIAVFPLLSVPGSVLVVSSQSKTPCEAGEV